MPVGEDAQEVLGRDLVPAVVDPDVIAAEAGAVVALPNTDAGNESGEHETSSASMSMLPSGCRGLTVR